MEVYVIVIAFSICTIANLYTLVNDVIIQRKLHKHYCSERVSQRRRGKRKIIKNEFVFIRKAHPTTHHSEQLLVPEDTRTLLVDLSRYSQDGDKILFQGDFRSYYSGLIGNLMENNALCELFVM